jgi:glycosyltransferase involved in cell wall biosynthesis
MNDFLRALPPDSSPLHARHNSSIKNPEISITRTLPEISIIIPAYNEAGNIAHAIQSIGSELRRLARSHEIIIVNDGSGDETIEEARKSMANFPVRIICLSRNFGKENAITAGLKGAEGKAVIVMDADLQEPVSYLETFISHWDKGFEMVYSVQQNRTGETFLKKQAVRLYYWFSIKRPRWSSLPTPVISASWIEKWWTPSVPSPNTIAL